MTELIVSGISCKWMHVNGAETYMYDQATCMEVIKQYQWLKLEDFYFNFSIIIIIIIIYYIFFLRGNIMLHNYQI